MLLCQSISASLAWQRRSCHSAPSSFWRFPPPLLLSYFFFPLLRFFILSLLLLLLTPISLLLLIPPIAFPKHSISSVMAAAQGYPLLCLENPLLGM